MQRTIIHKIICSFLICALALSITPKVFLHALVANHTDVSIGFKNDSIQKINKATINCNIENCVAHSPFIPIIEIAKYIRTNSFVLLNQFCKNNFYNAPPYYSALRGPPFC